MNQYVNEVYTPMFIEAQFTIINKWKTSKCLSTDKNKDNVNTHTHTSMKQYLVMKIRKSYICNLPHEWKLF